MKRASPYLVLALLVAFCFSLATLLQPRAATWSRSAKSDSAMKLLLGDSRRMFANQFAAKADISFHGGYYPSIFDQREKPKATALAGDHDDQDSHDEAAHEREMAFLGTPRDWIEAFGRHFRITEHTHLALGQEREILPWLRMSAELDPQRVDTYTVAAYWLRVRLGKVQEAEAFLREGLRNNPDSYEILFELGRLYRENRHDVARARNVWELALARWSAVNTRKKEPDLKGLHDIAIPLARLEEEAGNLQRALGLLELAKKASPHPETLQAQIEALQKQISSSPPPK